MPRDDGLRAEGGQPVEDPRPRLRVAVADPRMAADDDEIGREEDPFLREPEDRVAERVTAAVGDRLRSRGAKSRSSIERLVRDGAARALGSSVRASSANGVPSNSSTGVAFSSASRASVRSRISSAVRAVATTRRVERARAVDVVAVPVAEHDRARRRELLRRGPQLATGRERDVRVEDERLAAEVDEAGVADREIALLCDRREDAVCELLEPQAVLRSRASCSRRRMIGFASLTISSRYTM